MRPARRAARPDPLPGNICVAGGPARSEPGIAPGTGDLGPGRTGPTPAEPPGGSANVKVAQGEGNPEGNRRGSEPDSDGRRDGTGERRAKGNRRKADEGEESGWANGKPEESPDGKPEAVR